MEPAVQQFLSEFAAWANIPIQDMNEGTWMFYPLAYDATNVMLSAIEQVAQYAPDGSLVIGRQALSEAIRATKGFDGITGIITLDNKGNLTPP
jgi:branched-chain amino acid transport system substrate-binding protein